MISPNAILEIYKKNLIHNYQLFLKIADKSICAATIKANAYGLGDIEIFKILYKEGCNHFFLASTEEGIKIRKINKKANLYILNGLEGNNLNTFHKNNLIPILISKDEINILIKSIYFKTNFKFGIHVETGLNRLGVNFEDLKDKLIKKLNLEILISHLASSDELRNKYNHVQNLNFIKTFKLFKSIKYKSLSSSYGTMNNKNLHYHMIRPGITLYGGCDNINLRNKFKIKTVVILKGKILQIKKINKNEYIGYNQTFKTKKTIKVAIIGIGYADGISRLLSNKGQLFYKKDSYNIIGRVSMDSITVDITKSKYVIKCGQYMDIINEKNNIGKIAKKIKTNSNEILTSISKRVKREYI